eukprot:Hpha_TRINITY_DN17790_c0_g1::TRINITY_DN17790_c0_g1_i1::g.46286::m.46286
MSEEDATWAEAANAIAGHMQTLRGLREVLQNTNRVHPRRREERRRMSSPAHTRRAWPDTSVPPPPSTEPRLYRAHTTFPSPTGTGAEFQAVPSQPLVVEPPFGGNAPPPPPVLSGTARTERETPGPRSVAKTISRHPLSPVPARVPPRAESPDTRSISPGRPAPRLTRRHSSPVATGSPGGSLRTALSFEASALTHPPPPGRDSAHLSPPPTPPPTTPGSDGITDPLCAPAPRRKGGKRSHHSGGEHQQNRALQSGRPDLRPKSQAAGTQCDLPAPPDSRCHLQQLLHSIAEDVSTFWKRQSKAAEIARIRQEKVKAAEEKAEEERYERKSCGCVSKILTTLREPGKAALRGRRLVCPRNIEAHDKEEFEKPDGAVSVIPTRRKIQSLRGSAWRPSPIGSTLVRGCAFRVGDVVAWQQPPDSEDDEEEVEVFRGQGVRKW